MRLQGIGARGISDGKKDLNRGKACPKSLILGNHLNLVWTSLVAQMVKCLPTMREDPGSIPGSGNSPGEGNGNPLQYSCLENPMDGGA